MTSQTSREVIPFNYQRIANCHQPNPTRFHLVSEWTGLVLLCLMLISFLDFKPSQTQNTYAIKTLEPSVSAESNFIEENPSELTSPILHSSDNSSIQSITHDKVEEPLQAGKALMKMDESGQFFALGDINGHTVVLLADTGASFVMIPSQLAQRMGLVKGKPVQINTAAGPVIQYLTTLDTLSIGSITLHHVTATIAPDMLYDKLVLGMNVLLSLHMKTSIHGLELSLNDTQDSPETTDTIEESLPFKKPLSLCMKPGNQFDQHSLECLKGVR